MGSMQPRFNPNFTNHVLSTTGPNISERNKIVLSSLIRHLHDFIREVELTPDEWMTGVNFINTIGQTSTPTRNEGQRISDILGIESLVDEVAHTHMSESNEIPTSSSILGPFWSPNAPFRENGASIIDSPHEGEPVFMHGTVTDLDTKQPIRNAIVDIWQASSNGKYDFQDPDNQVDNNLRGKFRTDENGQYHFYCLHPTAYSLPTDGPAYELLRLLDRHPMRPAHIHLMISADGHKPVTTQIFPKNDKYVQSDTVFAVKDDLLVDFVPRADDPQAKLDLQYDIVLAQQKSPRVASPPANVTREVISHL